MKALNKNLNIQLSPAKIISIDNYITTGLFTDDRFLPFAANTLHTNLVLQFKNTDKVLPLHFRNTQLPLHTEQDIDLICANQYIIGYVDLKTEKYFYITNDFCKAMGNEVSELTAWIIGIVGTMMIFSSIKTNYALLFVCLLLICAWLISLGIKSLLNKKIENKVDAFMKTLSVF